jgi:hypothetical protein
MNKTLRNILIAVAAGIFVGIILGGLFPMLGLILPGSTASIGVGVTIGVTFALLNSRKS